MSNYGVKGWRGKFYTQDLSDRKAAAYACLARGEKRAALDLFAKHLDAHAADFDALHMAGVLLAELGKPERGLAFLDLARKQSSSASFLNNYGNVLVQLGRLPEADAAFEEALLADPLYAEAALNRGNLYLQTKQPTQALVMYERALSLRNNFADAYANRGIALFELGQMEAAALSFEEALSRNQSNAFYYCAYADLRMRLGQLEAAEVLIQQAIRLEASSSLVQLSLGKLHALKEDYYAAADLFAAASRADPLDAQIYKSGALAYYRLGDAVRAQQLLREALNLEQDDPELWWLDSLLNIPAVVASDAEAQAVRVRLRKRWARFGQLDSRFQLSTESIASIGISNLMYHGVMDKALYEQYGALCTELLVAKYGDLQPSESVGGRSTQADASKKIRICVLTGHRQSDALVALSLAGLYRRLDPIRFEVHTIDLSAKPGEVAALARAHGASYVALAGESDEAVIGAIVQTAADVLLYPDIGQHAQALRLAALRLCPRQVAMWTGLVTTGLPQMDYFLSLDEIEAADAQVRYSEVLVKLPLAELLCSSRAMDADALDLKTLGLDEGQKIVLCPGAAAQYQYKFMELFAQAWGAQSGIQFVFFEEKNQIAADLKSKLEKIAAASPGSNKLVFLPGLSGAARSALMRRSWVMLESLNCSDFNAALDAIACELPIVSVRSDLLRENFGAGLLASIGLVEYTAKDGAEALALLLRLLDDETSRAAVKTSMRAAKPALFDRLGAMPVLEGFFASLVKV